MNKFEPININIRDLKLFADIAFAVDSPFFIKRAEVIRKRYGITSPLRKNDYHSWVIKSVIDAKSKKETRNLFREITEARTDINLTVNYAEVLAKAVFGCDIKEKDYKTTYLINFQDPPKYFHEYVPKSELYAIVLTPQTRKKDVEKLFRKYSDTIKTLKRDPETADIFDRYDDFKNEIKRDREWYWLRQGGLKFDEIFDEWVDRCPEGGEHENQKDVEKCPFCSILLARRSDKNVIEKAVKRYAEKLKPTSL